MVVKDTNNTYIIPNIWLYIYKFNINDFLKRYKVRLIIRSDLTRFIYKDTYTTTLISRVFRCLIAIIVFFDLELYQLDVVNVFYNALLNELLYTFNLNG